MEERKVITYTRSVATYGYFLWVEELDLAAQDAERLVGQAAAEAVEEGHVQARVHVVRVVATCNQGQRK